MNYNLDTVPEHEIAKQFFDAMYRAGIEPRGELNLILDGKIHRFETKDGKHGNKNGAYKIYGDGCPNGFFQNWRLGEPVKWTFDFETLKNNYPDIYKYSQTAEFKAKAERKRKEREAQEAAERAKAVAKAKAEFEAAKPATAEHEYLKLKKIKTAHGLKMQGNTLLVAFYNINGDFQALQRIFKDKDGKFQKRFRTGTSPTGAFFVLGGHTIKNDDSVILAEGYATAATIYELLGNRYRVVMAVDSGNLTHVSKALKDKYNIRLFIAADDDAETARKNFEKYNKAINPGLDNAKKCVEAETADGYFAPPFGEFEKFDMKLTDWNDFAEYHRDTITEELQKAINKCLRKQIALTGEEFLSMERRRKWLIKSWLPENSDVMLFGASGIGKSFLALDMALSIANTKIQDWHGQRLKHSGVFYFAGEGHDGLGDRIRCWKQERGIDKLENFYITNKALIMDKPDSAQNAIDLINSFKIDDLKLIVIDTLNRHMSGDENSSQAASAFLNSVQEISNEFQCAVLVIHHTGVSPEAKDRGRGSSAFKAALDMELCVKDTGNGTLSISQTKSKDGKPQENIYFRLNETIIANEYDEDDEPITSAVIERIAAPVLTTDTEETPKLKLTQNARTALETYTQAAQDVGTFTEDNEFYGVRLENWRKIFYRRSSADSANTKRGTFDRARKELASKYILYIESDERSEKGDIYRPDIKFTEFIKFLGLAKDVEKITPTSKSECLKNE